jgi:hypothetical protein
MKAMTIMSALVLTGIGLTAPLRSDQSLADIAESDHARISAFVNLRYAPFVENYLKVFSGHFRCDYDFVDETEFDELAENALESLTASIRILLSERLESTLTSMTPEQLDYAAALVSMSVIDAPAERYTAELGEKYDAGAIDCSKAREENRALYEKLPASLEAIKHLQIPPG